MGIEPLSHGPGSVEEPPEVRRARATIRAWEMRNGHDAYVEPLDGGYWGYMAACWDCDWKGPKYLRGDEEMGTPESRIHKQNARRDAAEHRRETKP